MTRRPTPDAENFDAGIGWDADFAYQSSDTDITAFAGGGQASAKQLRRMINRVTTVASNGDSVKLPTARAGRRVTVINATAQTLAIYPGASETINFGIGGAPFLLAGFKTADFPCGADGAWNSVVSASLTAPDATTVWAITTRLAGIAGIATAPVKIP
jgi:hypothetical protein